MMDRDGGAGICRNYQLCMKSPIKGCTDPDKDNPDIMPCKKMLK